jgi:hypothetical protein
MMNRTRETAEHFDENLYAVKAMRMLDEIVRQPRIPMLNYSRILVSVMVLHPRRSRKNILKNSNFVDRTNSIIVIGETAARVILMSSFACRVLLSKLSGCRHTCFLLHTESSLGFCWRTI